MKTLGNNSDNTNENAAAQPASQTPAGGVLPRLVIRGETNTTHTHRDETLIDGERIIIKSGRNNQAVLITVPIPDKSKSENIAHIDWLAFTMKGDGSHKEHLSFRETLHGLFGIPPNEWQGTKSGWNGYKHRVNLGCYGLLAYGGKAQKKTTHVEINGHGCSLVKNWNDVYEWGQLTGSIITRCDLAHDDFEGKTANIDICQGWYSDGLFNANGRPPKPFLYDDCNSGHGKNFTVGTRANGKMARMYEKGKEQGNPNDPWFRIELELKHKDRKIPWDILVKPGQYLAGAYKAFQYLSIEQIKIKTTQKQKIMSLEKSIEWAKMSSGKIINVMLMENGGDESAVIKQLIRDGVPKRLEPYYKSVMS